MKKDRACLALGVCVICAVQPWTVSAAFPEGANPSASSSVVYQSTLDSTLESYPGELKDANTLPQSTIRVVRRGKGSTAPSTATTTESAPTRVDADKMKYTDSTGDVYAEGNVVIVQANQTLKAPRVEGNTKTTEYRTTGGPYTYLVDNGRTKNLTGHELTYRSSDNSMTADSAYGWSDPYYIKGTDISYENGVGHMKEGWLTTKNAMAFKHTPDYRIEGQDIIVYPGDKAVIKHASFFVKNTRILSIASYTVSLRHDKEGEFSVFSLSPRPMYNSEDGFGLRGNISYPLGTRGESFLNYEWFTKVGFKPSVGYRHYMPWGRFSFGYSKESNEYNNETVWVEKVAELRVDTNASYIGGTPFTIRGGANIGYWKEDNVKGMHKQVYAEVSHTPIVLWKDATIRFFGGYQRDYYNYNDSVRSMPYWGVQFRTKVNSRLTAWVGYTQRNIDYNNSPYYFDTTEIPKEFIYGGNLKLTRLDDLSANVKIDAATGRIDSVNYTWHRDLHSFDSFLTYKSREKSWEIKVTARDF